MMTTCMPYLTDRQTCIIEEAVLHTKGDLRKKKKKKKKILTKILFRSFSDKNFTGGYFWVKL